MEVMFLFYEDLLKEADEEGLIVREKNLPGYDGRIYRNRVAIRKDIRTQTQKTCVLAEELGHHYTTVGNILDQSDPGAMKQERKARLWAYNKLIGLSGIIQGYKAHCRSRYDLAKYLDVTEEFLDEALACYRNKYGTSVELDGYLIVFEPSRIVDKNGNIPQGLL